MKTRTVALTATLALRSVVLAGTASATEVEPFEYNPFPAGTNAALLYGFYGHHSAYRAAGGATITDDTSLELNVGIGKLARYFNIGETRALVTVIQPFGSLHDVKVGGTDLGSSDGLGDTVLAGVLWPINNPETRTYVGTTVYVTLPTGAYDHNSAVNLGGNRYVINPQVALNKGFGPNWSVDLTADAILYGDNDDAGAAGFTLTQDPTYGVQAFVNYAWSNGLTTSIGYQGQRGGDQQLGGAATGASTDFDEVRFAVGKFVTPQVQILAEVNHQFRAEGGFRQDFGAMFRILRTF